MASISLGSFYGYANGNTSYGYYNVTFNYDSVSRSGTTITVTNAYVQMKNPNSGYTTNTVYVDSVAINGTNVGISGSAAGGTSYHTWSTTKKNITFTAAANLTSVSVSAGCHRTGQSSGAQTCSGTLSIPIGQYTISYDANGGTGAPAAQTKTGGVALTISSTKPTKAADNTTEGYHVFLDSTGATNYASQEKVVTIKRTFTFDTWTSSKYNSIDYVRVYNYYYNKTYLITPTEFNFYDLNKDGVLNDTDRVLIYENIMADSYNVSVGAGGSLTTDANLTLYAKYSTSDTVNSLTLPTGLIRPGYTFLGWSTEPLGTVLSGTTYTPSADITLYARWSKNSPLMQCRNANGGFVSGLMQIKDSSGKWVIPLNITALSETTSSGGGVHSGGSN